MPSLARRLAAALVAALATAVQVLWVSPDAPSALDASDSPLPYLPWLCLGALLMTAALLTVLPRWLRSAAQLAVVVLSLVGYWLLLDYHEFAVRVAAWSTFGAASLWLHVLKASVLPIAVCATAFVLIVRLILRPTPALER